MDFDSSSLAKHERAKEKERNEIEAWINIEGGLLSHSSSSFSKAFLREGNRGRERKKEREKERDRQRVKERERERGKTG